MFKQKKQNTSKVGSEELRAFIESSVKKLSMLNAFPMLEKFLIRFNTIMPSSASCKRLFNTVEIIMNSRLNDETFKNY